MGKEREDKTREGREAVEVFADGQMQQHEGAVLAEQARSIEEIQAALVIAHRFPRREEKANDELMAACSRVSLAEDSQYQYNRGGEAVSGPSIRLVEAAARCWGSIRHGTEVIAESPTASKVRAYAWDLQTGSFHEMIFSIPKTRKAHGNYVHLKDPRDVYEHTANMATRRLRRCIERVLPAGLVEDGLAWCQETLERSVDGDLAGALSKMRRAFATHDVTSEMLARKLGHKVEASTIQEVVVLRRVYAALEDGYTTVAREFPPPKGEQPAAPAEPAPAPSVDNVAPPAEEPPAEQEPVDTVGEDESLYGDGEGG